MILDTMTQFREAMRLAGIKPPELIYDDAQLHRFATREKYRDNAGWYILYGDGIPAGSFGDWRTGISQTWRANIGRALSEPEALEYQKKIDGMRQAREVEEEKRCVKACKRAEMIWNNASEVSANHPYLMQKGIQAYGIREQQSVLIIPIRNNGVLYSLQFIRPDGNKRFLYGGKVRGGYFSMGNPKEILCICEGYATGASIFAATGYAVAVAFNANNLVLVAQLLRKKFPELQLILCADDDRWTEGNPGLSKAREAACRVEGLLAIPHFGENRSEGMTDFNDVHKQRGIEVVKQIISAAVRPIENEAGVKLICAADLEPKPISWVWDHWLAAGKFHLLAGAPGTGKTTIGLNLAAIITCGGQWPDGTQCEPGNVLIWSGEDDPQDTLLPRLLAHGANRSRVYFVSDVFEHNKRRAFDPSRDIPRLYERASQVKDVRLIIVDPIVNVVAGDSHKNGEVRRALQPLVELGDKLKAVILGISHFTKGTMGRDPLERVTGSIAFGALARVVLATAKVADPNGNLKHLLVRAKSNNGPDGGGYYYQIEPIELTNCQGVFSSQVVWGEPIEGTARALLSDTIDQGASDERSVLAEAVDFLKALLANGAISKKEISEKARDAGFKEMTLRRAKFFLGVEAIHEGYGKGSVWKWTLPSKAFINTKDTEDAHANRVNHFENNEHLSYLFQHHPTMVEGCKLSDILIHADPWDYEALKDPEMLGFFARSLKSSGKIKVWG